MLRVVENKKTNSADVYIYSAIGKKAEWNDRVGAKEVVNELNKISGDSEINVYINSPGGDVFEAAAIFTRLADHEGQVNVHIDGVAASAASYIAMVGDKIIISETGSFMIHNPRTFTGGDMKEIEKALHALTVQKNILVKTYAKRTKLSEKKISEMMDAETWMDPDEAVKNGFADEKKEGQKIAASFDLSMYENVPEALKVVNNNPEEPKTAPEEPKKVVQPNKTCDSIDVDAVTDPQDDHEDIEMSNETIDKAKQEMQDQLTAALVSMAADNAFEKVEAKLTDLSAKGLLTPAVAKVQTASYKKLFENVTSKEDVETIYNEAIEVVAELSKEGQEILDEKAATPTAEPSKEEDKFKFEGEIPANHDKEGFIANAFANWLVKKGEAKDFREALYNVYEQRNDELTELIAAAK